MSFAQDNAKAWNEIPELVKLSDEQPESANGPGATLAATEALREELPDLFARHNIRTVLDVGCGDWNWMSRVSLDLDFYIGWDVSQTQIEHNQRTFGRSFPLHFEQVNLLTIHPEAVPKVDLILCRHVLIHFPNEFIAHVLEKLRASGSKFLLTSHWPGTENKDHSDDDDGPITFRYRGYMERTVNMEAEPFNLFPYIDGIVEPAQEGVQHVLAERHYLGLFELQRTEGLRIVTPQEYLEMKAGPLPTNNPRYVDEEAALGVELAQAQARVTVTDPNTGITRIMGPPGPEYRPDVEEVVVWQALDPNCEHAKSYKVHTADGRTLEKCTSCHGVLDETKSDAGEGVSFMGALSRFGEKVQKLVDTEQMAKTLVLVDKDKLRESRSNLNEVVRALGEDVLPNAAQQWVVLGALVAVVDAILAEMTRDDS